MRDKPHQNKFRSPFEEEFYDLFKQFLPRHIKLLANYFTNGYEIDLVIWSSATNRFEAAIELDGRTYHQNPVQRAKDSDKTKFLESIGWEVVRVSSLEFFANKQYTVQNVAQKLGYLETEELAA